MNQCFLTLDSLEGLLYSRMGLNKVCLKNNQNWFNFKATMPTVYRVHQRRHYDMAWLRGDSTVYN